MSRFIIDGGIPLFGEIPLQGAKNAVLPILAASVLTDEECIIHNCPKLRDVEKTDLVLKDLGCKVKREDNDVIINSGGINKCRICDELMRQMRSSIIFLGAVVARCREAEVSMPGGCPIGSRPIDLHLKALREMGVDIKEEHGYILCRTDKLHGADIHLDFPSVGATENIMLAAVKAEGTTVVSNSAREPEITDLAGFLNSMGARITGAGTGVIRIEGVKELHGVEYTIMPDRIAGATYLAAAAITGGSIMVRGARYYDMSAMLHVLKDMGAQLSIYPDGIYIKRSNPLKSIHTLRTMPHPGFPTDIQSPFMALSTLAQGTSVFIETIFENRFQHVEELVRMGADIKVEGRTAVVRGVKKLQAANVVARELRGGAALIIAALAAEGTAVVEGSEYIDRGYESIEKYLSLCGAVIRRE